MLTITIDQLEGISGADVPEQAVEKMCTGSAALFLFSLRAFFAFLFTERLFTTILEPRTGYLSWRYWSLGRGRALNCFHHASHHSIMERPCDVENPQWTAKLEEYGPQALTTNRIEGLGQLHKENVQALILLAELFLDLSHGEYHVDCPSVSSEGTVTLRDDIIQEVVCDTV